jgi:cytochrome c oxidase assembly protein subunit 15
MSLVDVRSISFHIIAKVLSKILVFSILVLIFAGALVKSHEVGLSVPDWPTTYGYQMFQFPFSDMVGGIFYEHGHRMIATVVGFMTLILSIIVYLSDNDLWLKKLTFSALGLVIIQGLFGGLTVLLYLPAYISVIHAILAQTFFVLIIFISFSLSIKDKHKLYNLSDVYDLKIPAYFVAISIYIQLILGAIMRHTESGLAIPDFPLSGGHIIPPFNQSMIETIQSMHFDAGLQFVELYQIIIHYFHRLGAFIVTLSIGYLSFSLVQLKLKFSIVHKLTLSIILLLLIQIFLGAMTIWTVKNPLITSFHVLNGAIILGFSALIVIHVRPLIQIK